MGPPRNECKGSETERDTQAEQERGLSPHLK